MRFAVAFDSPYPADPFPLVPGGNLITGETELGRVFGPLTGVEADLLLAAAAIFAADLATRRGERERFTRALHLRVPVVNHHAFARVRDDLQYVLHFLSDDNWELEFPRRAGPAGETATWPFAQGQTLLFSGGLDSLAGAVAALEAGVRLQLASHFTANPAIRGSQKALSDYLKGRYGEAVDRVAARITGRRHGGLPFPTDQEREPSQRTRSFMFLVIGALAARRTGHHEVLLIAENGQMAIHLPLTAARLGAFSTHTAHPEVVHEMERLLGGLLEFPLQIRNPFLYQTKAECIATLAREHTEILGRSVSCWKASRQTPAHCGECVPCLVRRIALEANGVRLSEYARDLLAEDIGRLPPAIPGGGTSWSWPSS